MQFYQRIARGVLGLIGWRVLELADRPEKAVVVGYPHTSNWDFPIGLLAFAALNLDAHWAGKDTIFRGPAGPLMRALGGIPVNRREPTGLVERLAAGFAKAGNFHLVIAPEGTRALGAGWKSGFYRIARTAGVPVLLGVIDYSRREIGLLARIDLTGDEAADMARIAEFYRGRTGRRAALASPIRIL